MLHHAIDDVSSVNFWMQALPACYLELGDGHDSWLMCLVIKHAVVAFVDESCSHCGDMTISELRTGLNYLITVVLTSRILRSSPR